MRIDRIGIWLLNLALGVLCCYLLATILSDLVAEALVPAAPEAAAPAPIEPTARRTWDDRQVILSRNLFNASVLAPSGPAEEPEEDLEETKLPLALLGTAAAEDPALSWAAVEDQEDRKHLVVRVGDTLKGRARVLRIERRRIVLQNGPKREELSLQEDRGGPGRVARARSAPSPRNPAQRARDLRRQVRRLSEDRFAVEREDVEQAVRNPAQIFSQARILPKYEEGQMVGVQINSIKAGSLFEEIGIQSGDVITELNGISINSPEQSAQLLRELAEADEFAVSVLGADGQPRTLSFVPDD